MTYSSIKKTSALIAALAAGVKARIQPHHLDANFESLDQRVEAVTFAAFTPSTLGGVAAPGTITITGTQVRVQNRAGVTGDARAALDVTDQTVDLVGVTTGVKGRVIITPAPQGVNYTWTAPETGQVVTDAMTRALGTLTYVTADQAGVTLDANGYPIVPGMIPVIRFTRTAGGVTNDGQEDPPVLPRGVPYPLALGFNSKPAVSAADRVPVERAVRVPADAAWTAVCLTAATTDAILTLRYLRLANGAWTATNLGTVTFAAGAFTGTLALAGAVNLLAGDIIELVAPDPQDATLADCYVSVGGVA